MAFSRRTATGPFLPAIEAMTATLANFFFFDHALGLSGSSSPNLISWKTVSMVSTKRKVALGIASHLIALIVQFVSVPQKGRALIVLGGHFMSTM